MFSLDACKKDGDLKSSHASKIGSRDNSKEKISYMCGRNWIGRIWYIPVDKNSVRSFINICTQPRSWREIVGIPSELGRVSRSKTHHWRPLSIQTKLTEKWSEHRIVLSKRLAVIVQMCNEWRRGGISIQRAWEHLATDRFVGNSRKSGPTAASDVDSEIYLAR